MQDFLQAVILHISNNTLPVCDFVAGQISEIDCHSEFRHQTTQDTKPLACAHLEQAYSNQNSIDLCRKLAAINEKLLWTEAPRGVISTFMDDNHATVHIAGLDYGFFAGQLKFGAFLLAPNTIYPLHSHAAEEIYIPVSGSGYWRLRDSSYKMQKPGSVVHCQSWLPHAIRSGNEPLLMLWAWFGNTSFNAYKIEPNAFNDDGSPN